MIEPVAFHLLRSTDAAALAEITDVAEGVAHAMACGEYVAGFERFVDYWSSPGTSAQILPDKRCAMAAHLPKIALDFHATLNEPTRLEDFRSMAVPTLLLQGTSSPLPTRRICELLAPILPEAQLKTIGGAGHMAPVTHRDRVNAMIIAQLDANSGQASRRPAVAETLFGTNAARAARTAA